MKKSFFIVLIIGILSFTGLVYGIHTVQSQSDDMMVECRVLEGEPKNAAGITFQVKNQWSERLNWDVNVKFDEKGEPDIQIIHEADWLASEDFRTRTYFNRSMNQDIYMSAYREIHHDYENGTAASMEDWFEAQQDTYIEAFKAVAERTPSGEKYTETVHLGDYIDYYTVNLEFYMVDNLLWHQEDDDLISDYLRIKIPQSHTVEMNVTKDGNGIVIGYGMDPVETGTIAFTCYGDADTSGVYFSFYGSDGQNIVPLNIGAGNGIFLLPLKEREDGVQEVMAQDLTKVFALPDENCYPLELLLDSQKENLLLFTKENDKLVFRCIRKDTMQETVKAELCDFSEGVEIKQVDLFEEELFLFMNDGTMCYFRREDNTFKPQTTVNFGENDPRVSNYLLEYDWDYKDGKLAFLCEADGFYQASVYMFVFSENDTEYKAHFVNYGDYENDYGIPMIYLKEEEPLKIWFEKN